ncbi:MAG TPA: tRNA(Ile)(2)-agmatinylcytidine synthase [Thermoplasmata archaeon]|nr:tRNA(Ile)(2)-agmatinylcytidine synthase [Thermoplasmata archaeon]
MWVGIDDTDGPSGGCTTFALTEVLRVAREHRLDVLGAPRLVRLNPNIPWKTRGNAALCARLGIGVGRPRRIGRLVNEDLWAFPGGRPPPPPVQERFFEAAWSAVDATSDRGPRADPAMVAFLHRPPPAFYYRAVRSVVRIAEARRLIDQCDARSRTRGSNRGLIGATAAVAWPGRAHTWELIGYRVPARGRGPRQVDPDSVRAAAARFPSLFHSYDDRTRRLLVAPHTPCPVLFGLRSTNPAALPRALTMIRSEPIDRWVVFRTNQGTGDHLVDRTVAGLGPYEPARIAGTVSSAPESLRGGHVRFPIFDTAGSPLDCWVFEPTRPLAQIARGLAIGDRVVVWGGRGHDPAFRVEGIEIRRAPRRLVASHPPRCPECGRTADSLGRDRGYRCPGCRARFPPESARRDYRNAPFAPGTYHPTPSARRHLHPIAGAPVAAPGQS